MQTGIVVWLDRPVLELARLASLAEEAGFGQVWLPDHFFLRDVYAAQALMAERTTRIRLGTGVAAVQLRHPALIASSAATIHELSAGRAIIGIGPGGFEFPSRLHLRPASPLTLMRDAIAIIRGLLAGGADHAGRALSASGARLGWDPGPIPLFVSGRGPRMIELAGELADGVLVHGLGPRFLAYVREHVALGAERAGRDPGACAIFVMLDVEVDEDEAAAIERLRPRCTIMAGGSYTDDLIPVYGLDPREVSRLRTAVSGGDPAAGDLVTEEMVRAFAFGGPAPAVGDALARLGDLGVDGVILKLGEGSPEATAAQIERVRPALRGL